MRLHSLTLPTTRAEQLQQLALEDYRSIQQQAEYLLNRAIEQEVTVREAARAGSQVPEVAYAQTD
jgi:hypothetical protein